MQYVVGLTGGIGSGKTTVANLFAAKGIDIIDADIIAREQVAAGSHALKAIADHFGAEILLPDGELNRAALRQIIFNQPSAKTWLDNLLHPLIIAEIKAQVKRSRSPYCLLVAPLLIETKLNPLCNRVLVVDVKPETQIIRTINRDKIERQLVEKIIENQISRALRLSYADDVVKNDDSVAEVHVQVETLHRQYLALAT